MNKLIFSLALFSLLSFHLSAQEYTDELQITDRVIDHFSQEEYTAIFGLFDDKMKAAITAEKLGEIWKSLQQQCGRFINSGEAIAVESQGYVVVNQLMDFETTDLDIRLAFNNQKLISGLFFVPPVKKKE